MTEQNYNQRRACDLAGFEPKTYRYQSRRTDDTCLRQREGVMASWKTLYRLYREEKLTVRKRGAASVLWQPGPTDVDVKKQFRMSNSDIKD